MKGFRNILVHRYGDIDDRIVYEMATRAARGLWSVQKGGSGGAKREIWWL